MKKYLIFVITFGLFLFVGTVNAEENKKTCDTSRMRTLASNVSVTYELYNKEIENTEQDFNETGDKTYIETYLAIKIFNVNSELWVSVHNLSTDNIINVNDDKIGPDGAITIIHEEGNDLTNYEFSVYSTDNSCVDSSQSAILFKKIKFTLPKYNQFSELQICQDIQDYYLCQRDVTFDIDESTALAMIIKHKETLDIAANELDVVEDKEEQIFLSDYKTWTALGIVIVGIVVTVLILYRRKKK